MKDTLITVENDTITVGVYHNPPFVVISDSGAISGSDVNLVKLFAKELNASIKWVQLGEGTLFKRLEKYKIDLLIGGISKDSPWKKKAGFSVYYKKKDKEKYVMAIPKGENAFLMKLDKFLLEQRKTP